MTSGFSASARTVRSKSTGSGEPITDPERPDLQPHRLRGAACVSDPLRDSDPWGNPAIDWEATMAFRHHPVGLGFRIAEAMDYGATRHGTYMGGGAGTDPSLAR